MLLLSRKPSWAAAEVRHSGYFRSFYCFNGAVGIHEQHMIAPRPLKVGEPGKRLIPEAPTTISVTPSPSRSPRDATALRIRHRKTKNRPRTIDDAITRTDNRNAIVFHFSILCKADCIGGSRVRAQAEAGIGGAKVPRRHSGKYERCNAVFPCRWAQRSTRARSALSNTPLAL